MLQYLYKEGEKACSKEPLKVRLDGKIIGEIRKVILPTENSQYNQVGYQYCPKGQKTGGEVFPTVTLVQQSLAEE